MNKLILVIGICSLLTFSIPTITIAASVPSVNLPGGNVDVRMSVENATESWFDMTLTIPQGYDVINDTYSGWCVELDKSMSRGVDHQVRLYSSYDPQMPQNFTSENWNKVNYLINNYQGGNRSELQEIIWYYICNSTHDLNLKEKEIINYTNMHGANFVSSYGQKIAILAEVLSDGKNTNQRSFFEMRLPSLVTLGDFVWNDYDADGIQDANEPGLPGITVDLYTQNGTKVDSMTTNSQGYYSFSYFQPGEYYIKFNLPNGYRFSPKDQGTNDLKDSDVNPSTYVTNTTFFTATQNDSSWDAGMYKVNEQGNPQPPPTTSNFAPTADGTAGEPYKADVGVELRFNGSRSYDRDGTIVSWLWSLGDGTTANGVIITHTYTTAGTYDVILTVTDNGGKRDSYQTFAQIGPNHPPLKPTLTGPTEGKQNIAYVFNAVTTDPDHNDLRYIIGWGDNSQNNSPYVKSGNSVQTMHQWATWGFYAVQVSAQDINNLTSEINETVIAIDVRYVGKLGYLINTDSTGLYDAFYSNSTKKQSNVQQQNGIYSIDANNDGSFEIKYNPSTNTYQVVNPGTLDSIYPILIVGVIIAILLLLLLWLLARRKKNKPNP